MSSKRHSTQTLPEIGEDLSGYEFPDLAVDSLNVEDNTPKSMSDAAIDSANEEEVASPEITKPFRYKPTDSTSAILARATNKTGLTNTDIVTIALILLQNAAEVEVRAAVTSILQEKSQALFNSLK